MEAGEHDEERQIVPLSLGQQSFIDRELALFESLQGVSHVAEHRIVTGPEDQSHPGEVASRTVHLYVGSEKRLLANTHGKG